MMMRYMLFSGLGASIAALTSVAALARSEGRPAVVPINATSKWFWGDGAGEQSRFDLKHTPLGIATNICAGMFWGALFGAVRDHRRTAPHQLVCDGAILAGTAGALDYGILPRRLTPGWELQISSRSVLLSLTAMAAGAVLGDLVAQRYRL